MLNILGPWIKQLRNQMTPKWTQSRFAVALQFEGMLVERSVVAKIEGGFRKISDVEIAIIAKVLSITPNDLLLDPTDRGP